MSNIEVGMVDRLETTGCGPTDGEIAFARAYVTPGPMAPELLSLAADPQAMAQREQAQARLRERDWPNLGQYRGANRQLAGSSVKAVFMGDSLTEMWQLGDVQLFTDGVVCRGISGQTSSQMVLRFMADVVALKPAVVHILAGGNDLAGNTGPSEFSDFQNNIRAMVTLALAHGIRVVLGSLTPAAGFSWRPGIDPRPRIAQINAWLQALARERALVYADYHTALTDKDGSMRPDFARDGVHPTAVGYAQMRPVLMDAMQAALK
jgi:lysophospholipase L1-like esterase